MHHLHSHQCGLCPETSHPMNVNYLPLIWRFLLCPAGSQSWCTILVWTRCQVIFSKCSLKKFTFYWYSICSRILVFITHCRFIPFVSHPFLIQCCNLLEWNITWSFPWRRKVSAVSLFPTDKTPRQCNLNCNDFTLLAMMTQTIAHTWFEVVQSLVYCIDKLNAFNTIHLPVKQHDQNICLRQNSQTADFFFFWQV